MSNYTFFQTALSQFGACAVFITGLYAIFAGSWRERLCGGAYIVAYVAQFCFGYVADRTPVAYTLAIDLLCLPIFTIANRKSPHPWFWLAIAGQTENLLTDLAAVLFPVSAPGFIWLRKRSAATWFYWRCWQPPYRPSFAAGGKKNLPDPVTFGLVEAMKKGVNNKHPYESCMDTDKSDRLFYAEG